MSNALMRSDCRKFAPNIFNKSKCTNCFRQKEEHSAEALESNRATRKVAKCGYLFVAPGWDFSNPLNRTKRWQRRWFVLYDDGELSYSVDEHPDTVPQASIDMNKVLEVTDAEELTGNSFSLAVTTPDRVHFVKGTCREECRWWGDVLSVFPRSKGRHKRNATFPGGQSCSIQPAVIRAATPSEPRPRFNSCHTEPPSLRHPSAPTWLPVEGDAIPTRDVTTPADSQSLPLLELTVSTPADTCKGYRDQPASSASPPTRDKIQTEEKVRTRRVLNREKRGIKTGRSFSEDLSGMLPSWRDNQPSPDIQDGNEVTRRILFDDYENESKREEKLKDIADSLTRPRYIRNSAYHGSVKPTRDGDETFSSPASRGDDSNADKPVRGDPDGCGLDISTHRYSPSSELRVDLPAEDLLNIKKGWLMKQGLNKEWNKHWFVLRGAALMYYRDPTAEDKGIMDGVIDLSGVSSVTEVQVARNYGFQTLTWDERRYVLSAVTAGIRGNWILSLRRAAGLQDPLPCDPPVSLGEKLERELDSSSQRTIQLEREPSIVPSTPLTPRSILFSSDEEYRTASEGGRRESEDWGELLTPLPPSPPLNRTPISRVKEKARSRVYKRSRSSPPSSRRSTLDSVKPEDLVLTCCGELPESDAEESIGVESVKSSLYDTVDSQSSETDELKRQLSVALCEVSNAEKELLRLRHCKAEVTTLEKQVKELLATLQQTEEQLKHKTKEAREVEELRKSYNKLVREQQELLSQWRQQESWRELYDQVELRYRQDGEEWQLKLGTVESQLHQESGRCEQLTEELVSGRETIEHLRCEVLSLSERLAQGIEENESLYRRLRESEGAAGGSGLSTSREKGRSVESLSDLTNIDLDLNLTQMDKERIIEEYDELRGRFEKAVQEIRAMKRELRESHTLYDDLELTCIKLRQDCKSREESDSAQTSLMVSRIEDLTLKLTAAEKQVRVLKQKISKSDSREKRRSLSLKGRESFQICKELEEKLIELEGKIGALESGKVVLPIPSPKPMKHARSESPQGSKATHDTKLSASRLRRKSLDSATSSEPMKVLIRLSSLESKVVKATEKLVRSGEDNVVLSKGSPRLRKKQHQHVEVSVESVPEVTGLQDTTPDIILRLQGLEDAVSKSKDKVKECLHLLSSFKTLSPTKSHISPHQDNFVCLENRLSEVKDILQSCNIFCSQNEIQVVVDCKDVDSIKNSVRCMVSKLEELLRNKLLELAKRQTALKESGRLNSETRMHILAEKLAYESVLIDRIVQAIRTCKEDSKDFRKWVLSTEILECNRLMAMLKSKLTGTKIVDGCETSIAHLTKVVSNKLLLQGQLAIPKQSYELQPEVSCSQSKFIASNTLELLLHGQQDISRCVEKYKAERLEYLARALANETLSYTNDGERAQSEQDARKSPASTLEDKRIRQAWTMAQEAVNRELIQAEISHVTMRCGQLYESNLATEQEARFSLLAVQRAIQEQWSDAVESDLRREMEAGIEELTAKYESILAKLKRNKPVEPIHHGEEEENESRRLLYEFADVMAHKALVDARITLIRQEMTQEPSTSFMHRSPRVDQDVVASQLISAEEAMSRLSDVTHDASHYDPTLGPEFYYLFQQFSRQCEASLAESYSRDDPDTLTRECLNEVVQVLCQLEDGLKVLTRSVAPESSVDDTVINRGAERVSDEITWSTVKEKCSSLLQRVVELSNMARKPRDCQRCHQLKGAIHRLNEEHEQELHMMQQCQEQEMAHLRGELEQQRHSLVSQHEQEQAHLKERARRLERRLGTLDSEYTQQVDNLRAAYQKTLSAGLERDVDGEENIRHRYQAEIEQLRTLCEKGLVAMENSHRRIIAELEEKHRQELEQMRLEKEQALAEETQATLAALDAMRKAHEMEVQKEISKFKAEFIKKMQSTHDIGALHKEHEAEMEEIKQDILSLSERYSMKCVESSSLEEQLGLASKQLAQAQQHIQQLNSRNKQLRAHLVSEASEGEGGDLLEQRERELELKCEEVGQLQLELNAAKLASRVEGQIDPNQTMMQRTKGARANNTRNRQLSSVQN